MHISRSRWNVLGALALGALVLASPAESLAKRRPSGPIICKDNQNFTVRGVWIVTRGVAVVAKDNCQLTIVGSTIRAGVALKLSENAKVVLVGSDVSGMRAAVSASGNAEVVAKGGVLRGRVQLTENAEIKKRKVRIIKSYAKVGKPTRGKLYARVKGRRVLVSVGPGGVTVNAGRGGTTVRTGPGGVAVEAHGQGGGASVRVGKGRASVHAHGKGGSASVSTGGAGGHVANGSRVPKGLKASRPIVCGGTSMTVRNRYIRTTGTALKVIGACDITLIHCHLISTKGTAIDMQGSGDVKLVRSYVEGARRALSMVGSGDVVVNNSTVLGQIKKIGSGDIIKRGRAVIRRRVMRKRR